MTRYSLPRAVTKAKQGPYTQQNFRSKGNKLNGLGFYYILGLVFHNLNGHGRVLKKKRA